ncbi:MAG: choice-of-anchor B family protein [Bacteroidetes bacterium]|nr:choice-of-anchor B family protein [Bacteroidota bacterium]
MIKTLTSFLVLLLFTFAASAQPIVSKNISLVSHIPYNDICSDVEVYTDAGVEYAILGHEFGTSIISLANPASPAVLFEIPAQAPIMWHEVAVYQHYAYITNEGGAGLRIIDLGNLPTSVAHIDTVIDGMTSQHTLMIEGDRLYIFGANIDNGGVSIYSLADPWRPSRLGAYDGQYVHDAYVRNDTAYLGEIYQGFMHMVDLGNPTNPVSIGQVLTPDQFTHNTWLNDAGNICFTTDEVDAAYVAAYDISNPANIFEVGRYRSSLSGGQSIPHNVKVLNDFLVLAYYKDGVNIVDAARPHNMIEVGYFDTNPLSGPGFDGVWGLECFSPSGRIYAADMSQGFWVLNPTYKRACYLEGTVTDFSNGNPLTNASITILGTPSSDLSSNFGEYATGVADSGTYTIRYAKYGYRDTTITALLDHGVLTLRNIALVPNPRVAMTVNVIETGTGNPVANAGVVFQEVTSGIPTTYTTNTQGQLVDNNFMASDYHLIVGHWGHQTVQIDTNITASTNTITVSIPKGYYDDFTFDFGWTTSGTAQSGQWERGEPVGTPFFNIFCNPEVDDSTDFGNECYVTGNQGGDANFNDVDQGVTVLTSPVMDLSGYTNPWLIFDYWFISISNSGQNGFKDSLSVYLNNGTTRQRVWYLKDRQFPVWQTDTIQIASFLPFTSTMTVEVRCSDNVSDQIVEGAIDKIRIEDQSFVGQAHGTPDVELLKAFPNPSNGSISLEYDLQGLQDGVISILDLNGRLVSQYSLHNAKGVLKVDLALKTGMYFAVLEAGGSRLATQKLVRF